MEIKFVGVEPMEGKILNLGPKCKAAMTLLVAEVTECQTIEEVNNILKPWIEANDLYPEKVKHYDNLEALEKDLGDGPR